MDHRINEKGEKVLGELEELKKRINFHTTDKIFSKIQSSLSKKFLTFLTYIRANIQLE